MLGCSTDRVGVVIPQAIVAPLRWPEPSIHATARKVGGCVDGGGTASEEALLMPEAVGVGQSYREGWTPRCYSERLVRCAGQGLKTVRDSLRLRRSFSQSSKVVRTRLTGSGTGPQGKQSVVHRAEGRMSLL